MGDLREASGASNAGEEGGYYNGDLGKRRVRGQFR